MGTFITLVILGLVAFWIYRAAVKPKPTSSQPGQPPARQPAGRPAAARRGSSPPFAVVDVETSSLSPRDGRVIEVGIVHVDGSGRVTDRWETLVNPGDRTVGMTSIHGIEANWLAVAPSFEEVAGDIVQRLRGRVLVAHNAQFDFDFLEAEFKQIGVPLGDLQALCTMDVAMRLGLPGKLSSAASLLGISYQRHSAGDDAQVAATILRHALSAGLTGHEDAVVPDLRLPTHLTPSGRTAHRKESAEATTPRPFLTEAMLKAEVPDEGHDGDERTYLQLLEQALEDGVLDPDERRQLTDVANGLGLSHERALDLHHDLVLSMLDTALEDNRISKDERAEIEQAATWLDVDLSAWDDMVKAARVRARQARAAFKEEMNGKVVTFTGRGVHPQQIRKALATDFGMVFKTRVTADTELLVLGSDGVENQQTAAATERGLPVMMEAALWARLGVK
ncbi:exonuclease domain-containing protein [Euzebya sp.]|uniref:3'-5' exonuclease n=1 Tax=Euzebya sp. TaxID=1971409 RepID=UPI0035160D1C